jgi:hypothetical protein
LGELPKKAEQPVLPASETPAVPKVVLPKSILPTMEQVKKLDALVENEEELAAIENELEGIIAGGLAETEDENPDLEAPVMDDFMYGAQEEPDDEDTLDHIDDYEDIENLDKRLSGFDRDSEDY